MRRCGKQPRGSSAGLSALNDAHSNSSTLITDLDVISALPPISDMSSREQAQYVVRRACYAGAEAHQRNVCRHQAEERQVAGGGTSRIHRDHIAAPRNASGDN